MVQAGLLERRAHETDRCANRIRLKPVGRKKYEVVRAIALKLQEEILLALPEARREGFIEELSLVAEACHAAAENSPKK